MKPELLDTFIERARNLCDNIEKEITLISANHSDSLRLHELAALHLLAFQRFERLAIYLAMQDLQKKEEK